MIIVGQPSEFLPFGRKLLESCETIGAGSEFGKPAANNENGTQMRSLVRFRRRKEKGLYEEICAFGKTVVWSCSDAQLLKIFSADFTIIDAFWHSFAVSAQDDSSGNPYRKWDALCIIGEMNIDIYRIMDGERFHQTLPFSVRSVYSTDFGLLLERAPTGSELLNAKTTSDQLFPFLFSLSHPLNEIVPVICRTGDGSVRYTTNLDLSVVYSDVERSLLLTFDKKTGRHALWAIRKASKQDAAAASEFLQQSILSATSSVFSQTSLNTSKLTPSFTRSGPTLFSQSPSLGPSVAGPSSSSGQQTISLQQTTATTSLSSGILPHLFTAPLSSTPEHQGFQLSGLIDNRSPVTITRGGRLFPTPSSLAITPRPQVKGGGGVLTNPAMNRVMRLNSSGDLSPSSIALTPRSAVGTTPKADLYQSYFPSPALNSYHAGDYLHMSTYGQAAVPFVPDLCLEPLWVESVTRQRPELGVIDKRATKAVVIEDIAGGIFLCYLIPSLSQLRCLKITEKKGSDRFSVSGAPVLISCRDLAVFWDSKFMIIIDQNNCLGLYSGIRKISPLYCDAMALLSPPDKYASEFHKSHASRILSSSELPSMSDGLDCVPMRHTVDGLFSPVHGEQTPPNVVGTVSRVDTFCRDSPFFLVTLSSFRVCRCSVPLAETNPAVQLCLESLRSVLPSASTAELYSSWIVNQLLLSSPPAGSPDCTEMVVFLKFILDSTGFPTLKMFNQLGLNNDSIAEIPAKRSKCSEEGTASDWEYLIQNLDDLANEYGVSVTETDPKADEEPDEQLYVRTTAPFFTSLPTIFFTLHSCYEELKLNQLYWPYLEQFAKCLYVMASSLKQATYVDQYLRDFSDMTLDEPTFLIETAGDVNKFRFPPCWSADCFNVYRHVYRLLKGNDDRKKVTVISRCERVWTICVVYRLLLGDVRRSSEVATFISTVGDQTEFQKAVLQLLDASSGLEDVSDILAKILRLVESKAGEGAVGSFLSTLPPGVIVPLLFHLTPPQFRSIRARDVTGMNYGPPPIKNLWDRQMPCRDRATAKLKNHDSDGMSGSISDDELSKLLFPNDVRLLDVRSMLRSSKQTKIALKQKPGVADNEFREEQERNLYSVCVRTMALPIGRGMFTLRSRRPLLAESVEIPKLCLTGRTPGPQSLTIDLSHIDVPPNMDLWAKFHNGVAAGLRVASPESMTTIGDLDVERELNTSWIVYNMPRSSSQPSSNDGGGAVSANLTPEHAGFLFGLGLNGHLSDLALFNLHEYLVKGDPMTSIALLLGTAAAKCRTAELQTMKMLSTHLPFLLLPTLLELNIDPSVQTAAVLGVGLLYTESGNYRLAEALVREIGRPSTALNDNFADRESYALSCGFALGLITLGIGDMVFGDPNFTLASELSLLMNGGHKRSHHYSMDAPPSQLVKDGDFLNVHVTSAPAVVALGLMYLKSNNRQVAAWFDPPETLALLDTVRPDFLMLRIISKSIILWDDVVPRTDWVESHVPTVVTQFMAMNDEDRLIAIREQLIDFETVAQAYCNIVAGACFAIALKFAGSANADAFECLLHYYKLFDPFFHRRNPATWHKMYMRAGRYTTENALNVLIMALGAVMAGTGNLDVLRIIRHLRQRIGPSNSNWLLHGGQMATHMALGLLFLGGGRYSLSTSNLSVAALFCALYPKFPISPNDNRFHPQAFRHLYVLACEPRLLVTRDHLSSELVYCNINVKFKACGHYVTSTETLRTPWMLPELTLLEEVLVSDERYWPVCFLSDRNWNDLKAALKSWNGLEICRRAGFCTRKDDPQGDQSTSALFRLHQEDWVPPPHQISENESMEILESLKLWCAKRDCEYVYSSLVDMYELVNSSPLRTVNIWQLKLLLAMGPNFAVRNGNSDDDPNEVEFLAALELNIRQKLAEGVNPNALRSYIEQGDDECIEHCWKGGKTLLGEFLTFFDLPTRSFWSDARLREYRNIRMFIEKFKILNIPIWTAMILNRVLGRSA